MTGRSGPARLPAGGSGVDRDRPVEFTFDGRALHGVAGDTLASALLANGIAIVGRSFKYHRPRGVYAAGAEEPNAFVHLGTPPFEEPVARATEVELYDGLSARSINAWPSARHDLFGLIDRLHRFLPAGFYYKTFKWPGWMAHSRLIRQVAGLGKLPAEPDPSDYVKRHAWCDVLVIGSGPAGLKAARDAARGGAEVIVIEQARELGGSSLWRDEPIDGEAPLGWATDAIAELEAAPNVRLLRRTMAFGCYDADLVGAVERLTDHLPPAAGVGRARQRLWKIRAGRTVIATGAIERPLMFPDNDRPGVMLASAAQEYLGRFGVLAGRSVAVVTNNDSAYEAAAALGAAGAQVTLLDQRPERSGILQDHARRLGIELRFGVAVLGAGGVPVRRIRVRDGSGETRDIGCDLIAVSGGWTPTLHLLSQAGGTLRFDRTTQMLVPDRCPPTMTVVGAAAGNMPALAHGEAEAPLARPGDPGRQWIDFQNDVTAADVALAVRENFVSVEHLKRYTTTGMAVDQGKTSNVNALLRLAEATGRSVAEVGTTRFRPPFCPVSFGALAGDAVADRFHPLRRLALDQVHRQAGARFTEMSGWLRPEYYPRERETMADAVAREVRTVRTTVGLFDSTPLGKIEIAGADAAVLLGHFYGPIPDELTVGEVRGVLTLSDEGAIVDDSHLARLDAHRFMLVTTTAAGPIVTTLLERYLQIERPSLRAFVTNVTTQWATLSLAGPGSTDLLAAIGCDAAGLERMAVRDSDYRGARLRALRISFSGERAYELMVPARSAGALWDQLIGSGASPFGLEALDTLRIEKGYVHIGVETDSETVPGDIARPAWWDDRDVVGRRSLARAHPARARRPELVGLVPVDRRTAIPVGAEISAGWQHPGEGQVTSSIVSPTLGHPIALAMLEGGHGRIGETVQLQSGDATHRAVVTAPCFHDPEGARP